MLTHCCQSKNHECINCASCMNYRLGCEKCVICSKCPECKTKECEYCSKTTNE